MGGIRFWYVLTNDGGDDREARRGQERRFELDVFNDLDTPPPSPGLKIICAALVLMPLLIGGLLGIKALALCMTISVLLVALLVSYGCSSRLGSFTLSVDLASLKRAFGPVYEQELAAHFEAHHVCDYYRHTTDRDYQLLEALVGPGLHTQLHAKYPIITQGRGTRQPAFALAEVCAVDAKRVLEVGAGRGHFSSK